MIVSDRDSEYLACYHETRVSERHESRRMRCSLVAWQAETNSPRRKRSLDSPAALQAYNRTTLVPMHQSWSTSPQVSVLDTFCGCMLCL
eukprot:5730914-Amphidinium_carterae.3